MNADWIRKNKPTATLSDIIGGKSIVPFYAGALRQTRNPLADTSRSQDEWTEIPAAFADGACCTRASTRPSPRCDLRQAADDHL